MNKIIQSPTRIDGVEVRFIPNFKGVWGLYQYAGGYRNNGINYCEKSCITIQDMVGWNGLPIEKINSILKKVFGSPITLDIIKKNSFVTYSSENNSYFAAILKVKKLKDLEK